MEDSNERLRKGQNAFRFNDQKHIANCREDALPHPLSTLNGGSRPVQQQQRRNPPIAGELAAIARAQQGDGASFEILYNMHKRRVYSLCLRMLGNVAEAEDLTQEAFLQLHRKIARFAAIQPSPPGCIEWPSTWC